MVAPIRWKDEAAAADMVRKLGQELSVTDDGQVRLGWGGEYRTAVGILAEAADFKDSVRTHERIAIVRQAVIECAKTNQLEDGALRLRVAKLVSDTLARPESPFVLATSLSCSRSEDLPTVRYRGATLTFTKNRSRRFRYPEAATTRPLVDRARNSNYMAVRIHVRARDELAAGEIALARGDTIRAIWNFTLSYNRWRLGPGASWRPHNPLIWGPLHTLHTPRGDLLPDINWWEPLWRKDFRTSPIGSVTELKRFEKAVRASIGVRSKDVEMILLKYVRALDEADPSSAFLRLWSVLEDLTGTPNHPEVVKRASYIFVDRSFAKNELWYLKNWRNRISHDGAKVDEPDHMLNRLKRYVEQLIWLFIFRPNLFPTLDELGVYLSMPRNKEVLKRRRGLIDFALSNNG